jgi:hypothetical protein
MGRYLLVLDTDLLDLDEKLDLEPINYLVERQEQEQCEVVVLSLADTGQTKLSSLELLLGGTTSHAIFAPAKFPTAPRPDHDVNAAAEHRMNLTVRHLTAIGCQASGLISDEDLVKAVDAETRSHHYDEVILATSSHDGSAAGAHPAPGPDPPPAAPLGEEANRLYHRPRHEGGSLIGASAPGAAASR